MRARSKSALAFFVTCLMVAMFTYFTRTRSTQEVVKEDFATQRHEEFWRHLNSCFRNFHIDRISIDASKLVVERSGVQNSRDTITVSNKKIAKDNGEEEQIPSQNTSKHKGGEDHTANQNISKYKNGEEPAEIQKSSKHKNAQERTATTKTLPFNSFTDTDDILDNITFANLIHVSESNGLDNAKFLNWTKTYMLQRHKNSFQIPEWFVKGDKICGHDTEVIFIVPAVPDHVFTREILRQTWASPMYRMDFPAIRPFSLRTKLAFVFGTRALPDYKKAMLRREAETYNDVIAADFIDSYRNLTLKMMVGLTWVSKFCSGARYVVKSDLDTFINVPLLTRLLKEISTKVPRFIIGHKHGKRMPPVLRSGKWGVDEEDYPFKTFPPYLFGHSYVITGELVPLFVTAAKSLPLLPTEDAHITGVLARVIRAPRLHYKGFAYLYRKVNSCQILYNYEVSTTKMSVSRLILMWRDMLTRTCSERELPMKSNTITKSDYEAMLEEDGRLLRESKEPV